MKITVDIAGSGLPNITYYFIIIYSLCTYSQCHCVSLSPLKGITNMGLDVQEMYWRTHLRGTNRKGLAKVGRAFRLLSGRKGMKEVLDCILKKVSAKLTHPRRSPFCVPSLAGSILPQSTTGFTQIYFFILIWEECPPWFPWGLSSWGETWKSEICVMNYSPRHCRWS